VQRGAYPAAYRGQSAAASPQADIDPRRDVVHVLDGLSHLWQRLFHLFVGRVEQLFHRSKGSSQRINNAARASATISAATPNAIHMKLWLFID